MTASHLIQNLPPPAMIPSDPIWRLSVDQYHAMIEQGILTDQDRVELLDGMLVEKMPKNPPHSLVTRRLRKFLESVIPPGWFVDVQEPLTLPSSEPEPDLKIVRGTLEDYKDRHPGPTDVALVVEVSDATLKRDRETKLPLYAGAAIPEYWIVNLPDQQFEVHSEPNNGEYRQNRDYDITGEVPMTLAGKVLGNLKVSDVFA